MARTQRWDTLVSFKLAGRDLQKLDDYCCSHNYTKSELFREFVEHIVSEKTKEDEPVSG